MSAQATGLQLSIEAVADIEKGVSVALGQLRTAAAQMQAQIGGTEVATKKADAASKSWVETLKRYRAEQMQQGRQVRFMVDEIASIVPVSKEAEGALRGVAGIFVEGLAGGAGIGLAIEAVKLLAGYFRQAGEEARKAAEESAKAAKEITDAWVKSSIDVARARFVGQGGSAADFDAILAANEKETAAGRDRYRLMRERDELEAQLERVEARRVFGGAAVDKKKADIAAIKAAIATVAEQERQVQQTIQNVRDLAGLQITETTKHEIDKANESADGRIAAEKRLAEFIGGFRYDLATMDRGPFGRDARGGVDQTGIYAPAIYDLPKGFAPDFNSPESKKDFEDYRKELEETRKKTEELVTAGQRIGAALAASFGKGAKGAQQMGVIVLDEILKVAQAHVIEMATNWAAKSAMPWLAPAMVGAAFALGRGLIAQMPKRAMGGPVEAGRPYEVGERGREVFVPNQSGSIIPNHALGGTNIYMTVNAMDAASFRRGGRRIRRELVQLLADARRDGVG